MEISTLSAYLLGRRDAILTVARCRGSLAIGALLVLAAAFARHYDSRDLLHEPWFLLAPLAASTVIATILFLLLRLGTRADERYPGFPAARRCFLGLFWMTAPLALAYAVPYDRLLSPEGAVRAKLWTLAAVSAWRVLLMSRVISVVFGVSAAASFWVVMLLGDAAVLSALSVAKLPLIQFMGNIRQTSAERLLSGTKLMVTFLGAISLPAWLVASLIVLAGRRMRWQVDLPATPPCAVSTGLKVAAILAGLAWCAVLPLTQPAQRLRWRTERELKSGHLGTALEMMSSHRPQDYPPHWDPPPRPGYGEGLPPLLDVVELIADRPTADWVRRTYLEKLTARYLESMFGPLNATDDQWARLGRVLEKFPEAEGLRQQYAYRCESRARLLDRPTTTATTVPATGR
jgi:hypothetical protein